MSKLTKATLLASLIGTMMSGYTQAAEIEFTHFFGNCKDKWGENLDFEKASGHGECAVLTTLINKYNAENKSGNKVVDKSLPWGEYYDLLRASYASRNQPDVSVMHGTQIAGFAKRGLLSDLTQGFKKNGVDVDQITESAKKAIELKGKIYGLPYDSHGLLWHINVDLFKQAGLTDSEGKPVLPTSEEEWKQQAKIMKEKTGAHYFQSALNGHAQGVWTWISLTAQQNSLYLSEDGKKPHFNTPEGRRSLELINWFVDNDYTNENLTDPAGKEQFLKGNVAVMFTGTWEVEGLLSQAESGKNQLKNYAAYSFPTIYETPAVFQGNHSWVVPANTNRSAEQQAAAEEFVAFLSKNNLQWARTGHLPPRKDILQSNEYQHLKLRDKYVQTAANAIVIPTVSNMAAVDQALQAELSASWLNGKKVTQALKDAESAASRSMNR